LPPRVDADQASEEFAFCEAELTFKRKFGASLRLGKLLALSGHRLRKQKPMNLLVKLLIRIARGERLEKATSEDYRLWSYFILSMGFLCLGGSFFVAAIERANALTLWICVTVLLSLLAIGGAWWSCKIPARVSLALGLVTWSAFLWRVWPLF
jgi:hypothetical protein